MCKWCYNTAANYFQYFRINAIAPGDLLFGSLYNILIISSEVTGLQNMLFLLRKGRYFIKSLLLLELNDCANFAPTEQK